jgi:hypothetical protein
MTCTNCNKLRQQLYIRTAGIILFAVAIVVGMIIAQFLI